MSHASVEIIASDKERYIRVAAIDIVSSEGIRNICFMKRYKKPASSCDRIKYGHTIFSASDIKRNEVRSIQRFIDKSE